MMGKPKPEASKSKNAEKSQLEELSRRISDLEKEVDFLKHKVIHDEPVERVSPEELRAPFITNVRYVKPTSDGWIKTLSGGEEVSLPSGLKVNLNSQSDERDYITVLEGVHVGRKCDVRSGYLTQQVSQTQNLKMEIVKRSGGPVVIDGISYDLEATLNFNEGGKSQTKGPYAAKTDPDNPVPRGTHAIEIPDYPHAGGRVYGAFGTVWFRIGHRGDRYVHPGRVSAGCLTCAPKDWTMIYGDLIRGRVDDKSIGSLQMS